jgi:hypothetical protein
MLHYFSQENPLRSISGDTWSNGKIRFEVNSNDYLRMIPNKSYFKIRLKITKSDGDTQLETKDNIAPNQYIADNLFQGIDLSLNGVMVEQINDFYTQQAVLRSRTTKPYLHRENYGGSLNMEQCSFEKRQSYFVSDPLLNKNKLLQSGVLNDNGVIDKILTNIVDLGLQGLATYAYDATGGASESLLTFANAGGFDVRTILGVGDQISVRIANGNDITIQYGTISAVLTALTFRVSGFSQTIDIAARLVTDLFTVVRNRFIKAANVRFNVNIVSGDVIYINDVRYQILERVNDNELRIDKYTQGVRAITNWNIYTSSLKDRTLISKEIIWKPKLGFFDIYSPLPIGKLKIDFTPYSLNSFQSFLIESIITSKVAGTDFKVEITQMTMYPYMVSNAPKLSKPMSWPIKKMRVYTQTIEVKNLQQYRFDVDKKTNAIIILFQDAESNQINTLYSKSKFKMRENQDLNLQRLSIQYGNIVLPIDQSDYKYTNNTDYTTKWYHESLVLSNGSNDDTIEPIEVYQECGPYYYFKVPGKIESEELIVNAEFSAIPGVKPQIYVITEYFDIISIQPNGNITIN